MEPTLYAPKYTHQYAQLANAHPMLFAFLKYLPSLNLPKIHSSNYDRTVVTALTKKDVSPQCTDFLWGPHSLVCDGYQRTFRPG